MSPQDDSLKNKTNKKTLLYFQKEPGPCGTVVDSPL